MTIVHPNCANEQCYGAFIATKSLGLYQTNSLVYDDDSDPTWEHVGQILPISQFSYDPFTPTNAQVCVSGGTGWIRHREGNWVEVLTADVIYNTVAASGFSAHPDWTSRIGWIEFWPNNTIYANVLHGASYDSPRTGGGQYFMKSVDGGSNWYIPATGWLYSNYYYNFKPGSMAIQHAKTQSIPSGAVIYVMTPYQQGNGARIVYSTDFGESWNPFSEAAGRCAGFNLGYSMGGRIPVPSVKYIDAFYMSTHVGLAKFQTYRRDNWGAGPSTNMNNPKNIGGWGSGSGHWHRKGQLMYLAPGGGGSIQYTSNLEGDSPQVWNTIGLPGNAAAIHEYDLPQYVFVGFKSLGRDSDGQYHHCYSTDNMYEWYFKAGSNPNRDYGTYGELQTGSIHKDAGGTAIKGAVTWRSSDPTIPTEPPNPSGYGWPIWINAGAKELRPDPSWDRLYVVAETVWPAGEGFWNQPLLFQFILSGDYAGSYYENKGYLAFLPTIMLGQDTIYSGGIQYNGELEMHVDSPTFHQATVVGKFDSNKQVYHNEDLTSSAYGYISGWPTQGWELAGEFGAERVSSVAHGSTLIKDMTITYSQVDKPSQISGYPWDWVNVVEDVPFVVNTQLREGNDLYVGAEPTDTEQPIRYISIVYSGYGWQDRGGGLPELPVNDITRGDY